MYNFPAINLIVKFYLGGLLLLSALAVFDMLQLTTRQSSVNIFYVAKPVSTYLLLLAIQRKWEGEIHRYYFIALTVIIQSYNYFTSSLKKISTTVSIAVSRIVEVAIYGSIGIRWQQWIPQISLARDRVAEFTLGEITLENRCLLIKKYYFASLSHAYLRVKVAGRLGQINAKNSSRFS